MGKDDYKPVDGEAGENLEEPDVLTR